MVSGSVSDYSDTSDLRTSIAVNAGVDSALVSITVAAASVIITATIMVPASTTADAMQTTLSSRLGTASAASTALGITVESDPIITKSLAATPTGGGDDTAGTLAEASGSGAAPIAAIGGGAAVAILLVVALAFLYFRKKRMAAGSQSSVALTAISLTTTKDNDLAGGAPAAKGPTATTYLVELTKTPMGLGLSLTDDVVTEIKFDSQAARDGRIKVGDRVVTVNGEAPTTANPSSTILQTAGTGTVVKLKFTSGQKAVSAVTEVGQNSSVSADRSVSVSPSKARPLPPAVLARDSQKMRRAAELLESWKLSPSELIYGDKVGAGGQADVYVGRWQVIPEPYPVPQIQTRPPPHPQS